MAIPIHLLTGFLGSGKTTLLNHLLRDKRMAGTAVLVNEIGTIGIDHDLVVGGSDDMLLLDSGCLCCQPRGSIAEALMRLADGPPESGFQPPCRVIIETSGAANPIPILETFALTHALRDRFQLASIVTMLDAVFGTDTLAEHREARLQLASADCVVISKTDLLDKDHSLDRLHSEIDRHNTSAARYTSGTDTIPDVLFDMLTGPVAPEITRLSPSLSLTEAAHDGDGFDTTALAFPGFLSADAVQKWISDLLDIYGAHLLRAKGLINLEGYDRQAALQCVRDIVHPMHLAETKCMDADNRVVIISRDIHPDLLRDQLEQLSAMARQNRAAQP